MAHGSPRAPRKVNRCGGIHSENFCGDLAAGLHFSEVHCVRSFSAEIPQQNQMGRLTPVLLAVGTIWDNRIKCRGFEHWDENH